jgi:hypothetical protein
VAFSTREERGMENSDERKPVVPVPDEDDGGDKSEYENVKSGRSSVLNKSSSVFNHARKES